MAQIKSVAQDVPALRFGIAKIFLKSEDCCLTLAGAATVDYVPALARTHADEETELADTFTLRNTMRIMHITPGLLSVLPILLLKNLNCQRARNNTLFRPV